MTIKLIVRDKLGELVRTLSCNRHEAVSALAELVDAGAEFTVTAIPQSTPAPPAVPQEPSAADAIAVLRGILDHTADARDMNIDELREALNSIRIVGTEYLTKASPIEETALVTIRQVLQTARRRLGMSHQDALYKAAMTDICQDLAGLTDNSRSIVQAILGIVPITMTYNPSKS